MASKPNAADLLYGVHAIAEHLGMTLKQVYHLHSNGSLPTFKIGATVCARGGAIARHLKKLEREAR